MDRARAYDTTALDKISSIKPTIGRLSHFLRHLRIPTPSVIFHYTGADGLLGIVRERKLWASSVLHLNDS